jgi:hypothetical protein
MNCQLAFKETELVCLVPVQAPIGDILVHFQNSNILLVVRQPEQSSSFFDPVHFLVNGRAINYLATPTHLTADTATPKGDRQKAPEGSTTLAFRGFKLRLTFRLCL